MIPDTEASFDEDDEKAPGYISLIIVDKAYRNQGIGEKLLTNAEKYIKSCGKTKVCFGYMGTINLPWYIPSTATNTPLLSNSI